MRVTEMWLPHKLLWQHIPTDESRMCCFYCLLVHIMYIIHNKATFTVIENINPNIRNSKKFTINNHLLALDYIEY